MKLHIPLRTRLQEELLSGVEEVLQTIGIEFEVYTNDRERIWDFSNVEGAWVEREREREKVSLKEDLDRA